ncbi:PepSY-associated TM helix domain-containing protein [Rhodovibrionaceae bacterium A322]
MRSVLVVLHRYLGLATAIFLAVAGLTGSVLAFHHEIDEWLNPDFYAVSASGTPMDLASLTEKVKADHPGFLISYVATEGDVDHPAEAWIEPRFDPTSQTFEELEYNWIHLDPVTGETLGTRYWANCCFEAENFIPFLYEFHHTLTLPGIWGYFLLGVVAIAWTLDCVISLFLTFPKGRPFFQKWKVSWQVKRGAGSYRTNLDLHRAGGLWLWLILLPVAVSSIAMNLPDHVFKPVVSLFSPIETSVYYKREGMTRDQLGDTLFSSPDILARAEQEAERLGVTEPVTGIYFNEERNYYATGHGDEHGAIMGAAWLFFDGRDGALLQQIIPGEGTAGEIFMQLQLPIHGGRVFGLPGRIAICITGLVIFMLSVTGIVIWWKKRGARRTRAEKVSTEQRLSGGQLEAGQ